MSYRGARRVRQQLFVPGGIPVTAKHYGVVAAEHRRDGSLVVKQRDRLPWRRVVATYPPEAWIRVTFTSDGACVVNATASIPAA